MPGVFGDDSEAGGLSGSNGVSEEEGVTSAGLAPNRRTFLKAAVLGVGAAAAGKQFLPLGAYADDLSSLQCTANDVRIVGAGQVLNEPCTCNGTFTARVEFTVKNNAAADRYCIRVHLCPNPDAGFPNAVDLTLVNGNGDSFIPGKTTQTMFATIQNYPCGAGLLCFGEFLGTELTDTKGVPCPDGACCTTVTWNVVANDPCPDTGKQIPSKCRHQQVCIQGRGATTIDCDLSAVGFQNNCSVPCNGNATIRLCTTGGPGPYTFTLREGSSNGPVVGGPVEQAGLCKDFTVGPITAASTTYYGTVCDKDGCCKTASVTITTTPVTPTVSVSGTQNCNGVLTFTVSVPGFTLSNCSVTWKVDDVTVTGNADKSLTYNPRLDGVCHVVKAVVDCGGCTAEATKSVSQCATTTVC